MIKPPCKILASTVVLLLLCGTIVPLLAGGVNFQVSIKVGDSKITERGKLSKARTKAHVKLYSSHLIYTSSIRSTSPGFIEVDKCATNGKLKVTHSLKLMGSFHANDSLEVINSIKVRQDLRPPKHF